jgi:hypothetical protein
MGGKHENNTGKIWCRFETKLQRSDKKRYTKMNNFVQYSTADGAGIQDEVARKLVVMSSLGLFYNSTNQRSGATWVADDLLLTAASATVEKGLFSDVEPSRTEQSTPTLPSFLSMLIAWDTNLNIRKNSRENLCNRNL